MKNVKILDCTLRDGGRIINCEFANSAIKEISEGLTEAKIDIIELGFLRDKIKYNGNSTFFTDVEQIKPFIKSERKDTLYVAFVDFDMFDFNTLPSCDGTSINGIRVGFKKEQFNERLDEVIDVLKLVKERGYLLFVQGVNSLSYTDKEMLELIEIINIIEPYSFGIVDTYGAMYIDDVRRIYNLINHNLFKEISIDLHAHNNFQLAFAFAQEIISCSDGNRNIIVDSTLNGMGKCAGNLNTELIVDYLIRKKNYDYDLDRLLDVIDEYIYRYKKDNYWGYSIPAFMAGIYKSHPNNVIYLTEKFRMDTKDIKNIIAMIEPTTRERYDYYNIERVYIEYFDNKVDDKLQLNILKERFKDRKILILVPGRSLVEYENEINNIINTINPIVVSVNFVYGTQQNCYAFFGNKKRYKNFSKIKRNNNVIITSNIKSESDNNIVINYYSLIQKGYKFFDNTAIMLLRLLQKIDIIDIMIAGFDGFSGNEFEYADVGGNDELEYNRNYKKRYDEINSDIKHMIEDYADSLKDKSLVKFITPSRFEKVFQK